MNGETILVVDDNKEIVYSISELLKYEGYQVVKAYDGMEALKALETNQIDLILLDVMMPKLNGLSALMKLRENYRIPVIILSAKTNVPWSSRASEKEQTTSSRSLSTLKTDGKNSSRVETRKNQITCPRPSKSGTYLRCAETVARPASMLCQRRARQTDGQRVQAALRACETPRRSHDP